MNMIILFEFKTCPIIWKFQLQDGEDYVECDEFIFEICGNEDLHREKDELFQLFKVSNTPVNRENIDHTTNAYGYQLIDFCRNNNMFILNGRLNHDTPKLTCKNSSMVDYMISTVHNFGILLSLTVHDFDSLYSDAHYPISLYLKLNKQVYGHDCRQNSETEPQVRLWDSDKKRIILLEFKLWRNFENNFKFRRLDPRMFNNTRVHK